MAELSITLPDGRSLTHTLGEVPQVAGRDAACEIFIDDPSVSRQHVRFSPGPDGYTVEDLGSKNGTFVNDNACTSQRLYDGDQIQIGSAAVTYQASCARNRPSVVISEDAPTTHATKYVSRDQDLNIPKQRLKVIYELSDRLTTLQDRDSLLDDAMAICFEMLHFERGAIGVRRSNRRSLDWPVVRNLRGVEGELTISRTLLRRALEEGERAIFTGGDSAGGDPTMSIVQHGIRSAMCVPLLHGDGTLGVIYGDRTTTSTVYTDEDVDFFAGIAQQVSIGLINSRLLEEQREMARLNHDIAVARKIQTGLLPAHLPSRDGLKIAALNDPGQRVSGDYYDVIETDDGRVWCLIADVTGEGVAAALLVANLQAAVRVMIDQADDPARLLTQWNRLVWRNTDSSKFITCVLALIDPEARSIRYCSAGHLPPIILRQGANRCEELTQSEASFPLGIVEDATFVTDTVDMGDEPYLFLCYTDGVIEAMNNAGDSYGFDRLTKALSAHDDLNPQVLVKQIRKSVSQFANGAPQSDDITVLAARVG